jgi:transketolase
MAIAEKHLAATFNRPGFEIINHYTYVITTDGDLMEGISSEAASLAGHLQLEKLIYLYDSNRISIEGSTDLAFTEDVAARFKAYGWHVEEVSDGNDVEEIDAAILRAKAAYKPSLIVCHTTIGYGLPTKAGTAGIHGSPAGWDELNKAKELVGWPIEPLFYAPEETLNHFGEAQQKGYDSETAWKELLKGYKQAYPEMAEELERRIRAELPDNWRSQLPVFAADTKGMASRVASGKTINALAAVIPELLGGSADLAPSNNTLMEKFSSFTKETPGGRNIHFGVREMSMAAITNGIAVHGGLIPYCATFLIFSDYLRGSLRVAALSRMRSIYVFTHDSVAVGEDGPTHEPVETLMSLRLMPQLDVIRPADANETVEAWAYAMQNISKTTALILSRQNLPILDREKYASAAATIKGAYVLYESDKSHSDLMLIATGSEVSLAIGAVPELESQGVKVRVVSFPSWELFDEQPESYRKSVFPKEISKRLSIEAGVTTGWEKWVGCKGDSIGINRYGASAPGDRVMQEFGFTIVNVVEKALKLLNG